MALHNLCKKYNYENVNEISVGRNNILLFKRT